MESYGKSVGGSSPLPVITFNFPGRSGTDAEDIEMLKFLKTKARVLCLQEFGGRGQLLTEAGWSYRVDGGQVIAWHNARLVDSGSHWLNDPTKIQAEAAGPTVHKAKNIGWVILDIDGRRWKIGNMHMVPSKHLGGAARQLWLQQRNEALKWNGDILCGDFNATPTDKDTVPFQDKWRLATDPRGTRNARAIDWVLNKTTTEAVRLERTGGSDHHPVRAVL